MGLAVAVLACNKEIPAGPQPAQEHITLDFTIDDDGSPETKAVKTGWVNNDRMYVFFDDISETAGYLIIKYSSSTKKWNPETWTPGLESKLYHRTSGKLAALYLPNDKVGGSLSVEPKYLASSGAYVYSLKALDRIGNEFYTAYFEATGVSFTVNNGVLKASFNISVRSASTQFHLPAVDAAGTAINTTEYHLFFLNVDTVVYGTSVYRYNGETFSGQGIPGEKMSAYNYQGLCVSGWYNMITNNITTFHFWDYRSKKKYKFTTDKTINPYAAYSLPALNAKDSNGNRRWVVEGDL